MYMMTWPQSPVWAIKRPFKQSPPTGMLFWPVMTAPNVLRPQAGDVLAKEIMYIYIYIYNVYILQLFFCEFYMDIYKSLLVHVQSFAHCKHIYHHPWMTSRRLSRPLKAEQGALYFRLPFRTRSVRDCLVFFLFFLRALASVKPDDFEVGKGAALVFILIGSTNLVGVTAVSETCRRDGVAGVANKVKPSILRRFKTNGLQSKWLDTRGLL